MPVFVVKAIGKEDFGEGDTEVRLLGEPALPAMPCPLGRNGGFARLGTLCCRPAAWSAACVDTMHVRRCVVCGVSSIFALLTRVRWLLRAAGDRTSILRVLVVCPSRLLPHTCMRMVAPNFLQRITL